MLDQAIVRTEEESTKKMVEAKTARNQAEKLGKECGKTEKERVKAQGEVETLMASIQVRNSYRSLHYWKVPQTKTPIIFFP
jgi:hypothetical protein